MTKIDINNSVYSNEAIKSALKVYVDNNRPKLCSIFSSKEDEFSTFHDLLAAYDETGLLNIIVRNINAMAKNAHEKGNSFGYISTIITSEQNTNNIYKVAAKYLINKSKREYSPEREENIVQKIKANTLDIYEKGNVDRPAIVLSIINAIKHSNSFSEAYSMMANYNMNQREFHRKNNGNPSDGIYLVKDSTELQQLFAKRKYYVYIGTFGKGKHRYIGYVGSGTLGRLNDEREGEFFLRMTKEIKNSYGTRIQHIAVFDTLEEAREVERKLIARIDSMNYDLANIIHFEKINGCTPVTQPHLNSLLCSARVNMDYIYNRKINNLGVKKFMSLDDFNNEFGTNICPSSLLCA